MKTFSKWLKLREAQTGGTKRPKATGETGFVANRSQFWGPAAHFGHDPSKVQTIRQKAIGAVPAAVGSIFSAELGYTPEAVPFLEKWPKDTVTQTHVIKEGTLELQVLIKLSPECRSCGDDLKCMWQNCEIDIENMNKAKSDSNFMDSQILNNQAAYPSIFPNPADQMMMDEAKEFTEALIMRDMWQRLLNDPSGNQTEYVDFKNAKAERRIEGTGLGRTLTLVALFPRTDKKQPGEYE